MPAEVARVNELFLAALDVPVAERAAYLDGACGADADATDAGATAAFAHRPQPAPTQAEPGAQHADAAAPEARCR